MDVLECSKEITENDVYMAIELGKMKESYDRIGKIIESGSYKYSFLKRSILINIVDNETDVNEAEISLNAVNNLDILSYADEEKFLEVSFAGMLNIFNEEYSLELFNLCLEIGKLEFRLSSYLGLVDPRIDEPLAAVLSAFIERLTSSILDDSIISLRDGLTHVGIPTDLLDSLDLNDKEQVHIFLNKLKQLIIDTCNSQVLSEN